MEDKMILMRSLVEQLNQASDVYYNGKGELMTDYEWDAKFDQLKKLEEETGEVLPDSPTNKVSEDTIVGKKEEHEFAALSLAKTKLVSDLVKWAEDRPIWISWKLDGLTLVVTYDNGKLSKIVTRGNGHIGTNITHLASAISGIPKTIKEKGHLVIRGEAVISYADFEQFIIEKPCFRFPVAERRRGSKAATYPMGSLHPGLHRTGNQFMGRTHADAAGFRLQTGGKNPNRTS